MNRGFPAHKKIIPVVLLITTLLIGVRRLSLYAAPADTVTTNDNVASVSEPTRSEYPVGEEQNSDLTTMALTSRIENGVYAIQNLYSNMYIDIVQDSPNAGAFLQQYNFNTSPASNSGSRLGLYKLEWISGNDYVIRTMVNNGNTFIPTVLSSGSYLQTSAVSPTTSSVPDSQKWTITLASNGYIIRPENSTTLAVCVQNNSSSGGGATNTASRLTLQNRSDNYAKWTFIKLDSNISFHGVGIKSSVSTLLPGEIYAFSAYMWSTDMASNGPVIYGVRNSDNTATDAAAINSSTGLLTAVKPASLSLRYTFSGNSQVWYSAVKIEKPLEGCYFIQCYDRLGVWDVDSTSAGKVLECQEIDQKIRCLWKFEYQNNGYYVIKNDVSGYYVTNVSGSAKQTVKSGSFTGYQLWKLIKRDDSTYKIQSKADSAYYITEENANHSSVDPDILVSNTSAGTRQKWFLKPLTLNLNVYYDSAFKTLYSSYSVTPEQFVQKVFYDLPSTYTNGRNIEQAFMEEFGVHINVHMKGLYLTNPYVNDCELRNSGTSTCYGLPNCASSVGKNITDSDLCSTSHHKNSCKLRDSTPASNKNTWAALNVLFTGHRPCYVDGTVHRESGLLGVAGLIGDSYTRCAVFPQNFTYKTDYAAIRRTLAHEIMHVLGAEHHYNSTGDVDIDRCIHGYYRDSTSSSNGSVLYHLTVCDLCEEKFNTIKTKLYTQS